MDQHVLTTSTVTFGNATVTTTLTAATINASALLTVTRTAGEQLRLTYDGSNYLSATVGSTGIASLSATGSGAAVSIAEGTNFVTNESVILELGAGETFRFRDGATDGFSISRLNPNSWGYTGLSGGSFFNVQNAHFIVPDASLGVGTTAGVTPSAKMHALSTTEQLRLGYDTSNYVSTTVGSTGAVTFNAVGAGSAFTFSDAVTLSSTLTASGAVAINSTLTVTALTGASAVFTLRADAAEDALDTWTITATDSGGTNNLDIANNGSNVLSFNGVGNIATLVPLVLGQYAAVDEASETLVCDNSTDNSDVDIASQSGIRVTASSGALACIVSGFTGGAAGRILVITNAHTQEISLSLDDTTSTAANRITYQGGTGTFPVVAGTVMILVYDSTTSRWRIVNGL
jgi:YD repeat-containing protein